MVKWMLDWDIRWEEAGVTLGTERCKEGAWGCSGGRRWGGEPNIAGTWIQGSHLLLDWPTGFQALITSGRSNQDQGKLGMTSSLCPHRHHLQAPSAHPHQEFLDWVWQLLLLLPAAHQHMAVQGKGSEPGCSCRAPPLVWDACSGLLPLERCVSETASEHLPLKPSEMLRPGDDRCGRALQRSLWETVAGLIPGLLPSVQRGAPSGRLQGAVQALLRLQQPRLSSMGDRSPGSNEGILRNIK